MIGSKGTKCVLHPKYFVDFLLLLFAEVFGLSNRKQKYLVKKKVMKKLVSKIATLT